jgi:hypothetical protein
MPIITAPQMICRPASGIYLNKEHTRQQHNRAGAVPIYLPRPPRILVAANTDGIYITAQRRQDQDRHRPDCHPREERMRNSERSGDSQNIQPLQRFAARSETAGKDDLQPLEHRVHTQVKDH